MNDLQHIGVLRMHWGIRRRGPAAPEHTRAKELEWRLNVQVPIPPTPPVIPEL